MEMLYVYLDCGKDYQKYTFDETLQAVHLKWVHFIIRKLEFNKVD